MFARPICSRNDGPAPFRSGSCDEDGGNLANIAASEASNKAERERTRVLSANDDEVGESIA
jgi:hypothetical protein